MNMNELSTVFRTKEIRLWRPGLCQAGRIVVVVAFVAFVPLRAGKKNLKIPSGAEEKQK